MATRLPADMGARFYDLLQYNHYTFKGRSQTNIFQLFYSIMYNLFRPLLL